MADKAGMFLNAWRVYFMSVNLPQPELQPEYNFDAGLGRCHRFDFADPAALVAVEVEGNAWNVRGGGRHMQDSDMEKYNLAAGLGWRVFRFSPAMLKSDPLKCAEQVYKAICNEALHGMAE